MTTKTRNEAEKYYREVRREARFAVEGELKELGGEAVRLTDINEDALLAVESWRDNYPSKRENHIPGWNWRKEVCRFRSRPRRVEIALWYEQELCGMALGRISDRCIVATIHLIESNPSGSPLAGSVAPFIVRFLETLAVSVGCKEVSIEQPAEGLVQYYAEIGFVRKVTKGNRVVRQKMYLNSRLG